MMTLYSIGIINYNFGMIHFRLFLPRGFLWKFNDLAISPLLTEFLESIQD